MPFPASSQPEWCSGEDPRTTCPWISPGSPPPAVRPRGNYYVTSFRPQFPPLFNEDIIKESTRLRVNKVALITKEGKPKLVQPALDNLVLFLLKGFLLLEKSCISLVFMSILREPACSFKGWNMKESEAGCQRCRLHYINYREVSPCLRVRGSRQGSEKVVVHAPRASNQLAVCPAHLREPEQEI